MKILNAKEADLSAALGELSARLGIGAGMVSAASREKTLAVFGREMTPLEVARQIVEDVRERGDEAVAEYARKLDGAELSPERFRVNPDLLRDAWDLAPEGFKRSLRKARESIEAFQRHIMTQAPSMMRNADGGYVGVAYRALRRAAVYVPGGRASYPSTVLMTAIPARVAGVEQVVMATPCGPDGAVRRETLAAAHEAGITEAYRIGGAQAIAALAYGTETIPRVDKIVGPGNAFVTLAKREIYGAADLDMLAGPSEILIIADGKAEAAWAAADMLSQAEHDPAAAVLLTPDEKLARRTLEEIERQLPGLSRAAAARDCLEKYGIVAVTRDLDQAVELANQFAPEHLELAVRNADELLRKVRNAGAVFMGQQTPEPVGDYVAGPSHVLPTGGTARFFHGLSVNDFLRPMSVIQYDRAALKAALGDVDTLARAEGLDAHARAAGIRFANGKH